jgi:polyketide cyclase/dehydrase/lipid transport protein
MLLRRSQPPNAQADAWTAQAAVRADADQVLQALTDPARIAAWAPVDFEVDGLAGGRLIAGSRERVCGTIAGVHAKFEVEVARADTERLELVAHGPVSFDVTYAFRGDDGVVVVDAQVSLRRQRGLAAQLLRTVAAGLLSAGALGGALARLEASLTRPVESELLAA